MIQIMYVSQIQSKVLGFKVLGMYKKYRIDNLKSGEIYLSNETSMKGLSQKKGILYIYQSILLFRKYSVVVKKKYFPFKIFKILNILIKVLLLKIPFQKYFSAKVHSTNTFFLIKLIVLFSSKI